MPPKDDKSYEYWLREVAWNRATLRSYLQDFDQMDEKLERQADRVKRLQGSVELFKRICQALHDGMVTIVVVSVIIIITLFLIEASSERTMFVIGWELFCAVMCLVYLICSMRLWKLQERLSKEIFQRDAFEYELGRIAADIECVKCTLMNLMRTAQEAYGEA